MNGNSENRTAKAIPQRGDPAPRKRLRIEKLEERIAPKKGGKGTHNCSNGGSSASGSGGSSSGY
jgi:hypothetical protein